MTDHVLATLVGLLSWTLAEYLVHRVALHGTRRRSFRALDHRRSHHGEARSQADAPVWPAALLAALALPLPGGAMVGGRGVGLAAALGWMSGYLAFERARAVPAAAGRRSAYRRAMDVHRRAHQADPSVNLGVTSPMWDLVLGTWAPVAVRVEGGDGDLEWAASSSPSAPGPSGS